MFLLVGYFLIYGGVLVSGLVFDVRQDSVLVSGLVFDGRLEYLFSFCCSFFQFLCGFLLS